MVPMSNRRTFLLTTGAAFTAAARPLPSADTDEPAVPAPAGAAVLFNGKDLSAWVAVKTGKPAAWKVESGYVEIVLDTGDIRTRDEYGDSQLHLEFRIPEDPRSRGNSGVYLQGKYEVQIIDSYDRAPELSGCGALYREVAPLRNASKRPGLWQSFDIAFRAPRYEQPSGALQEKGLLTVFHNRILVQNNTPIPGMTGQAKRDPNNDPKKPGPIVLQNHGSPVRFRNIWMYNLST